LRDERKREREATAQGERHTTKEKERAQMGGLKEKSEFEGG